MFLILLNGSSLIRVMSNFLLFRPWTVIYVGNDALFTLTKLAMVLLKSIFSLAFIVPGKFDYILTFPHCIQTTQAKYP